jgi:hypothetical protein
MFRGVELDGEEIIPQLNLELCSRSSYSAIAGRILDSHAEASTDKGALERLRRGVERREPIQTTIVRELSCSGRALTARDNMLDVDGFGTVHFGELLLKPGRRRLNLLRFELGTPPRPPVAPDRSEGDGQRMYAMAMSSTISPLSGTLTVGSGDGNGAPVWPHG